MCLSQGQYTEADNKLNTVDSGQTIVCNQEMQRKATEILVPVIKQVKSISRSVCWSEMNGSFNEIMLHCVTIRQTVSKNYH